MRIDFDFIDFSHCLRIEYTKLILKELTENGNSINLISDAGTGKSRLLKDLESIVYPDLSIVYVNLKDYLWSYKGLNLFIKEKLKVKGNSKNLSQIFSKICSSNYCILLIDNYDAILQELKMDIEYDEDFFNDLNVIKNMHHVSILCSTKVPHNNMLVYIGGKNTNRNSWLTLERENLPKLTFKQIEEELRRQIISKELFLDLNDARQYLVRSILKSIEPYSLLIFVAKQLNSQTETCQNTPINRKLKSWTKQYKKQKTKSIEKFIHVIMNWLLRIWKVTRLEKIGNPLVSFLAQIINLFTRNKL